MTCFLFVWSGVSILSSVLSCVGSSNVRRPAWGLRGNARFGVVLVALGAGLLLTGCSERAPRGPVGANLAEVEKVLALLEDPGDNLEGMVEGLEAVAASDAETAASLRAAIEQIPVTDLALDELEYAEPLMDALHRLVAAHKRNLWALRAHPELLLRYRNALDRLAPRSRGAR